MAMFTDIVLNKETGRHELHFVNQQYDFLMTIYFDDVTKTYRLSCDAEEAIRITKYWSGRDDFDVQNRLKEGEQQLRKADKELTQR